MGLRLHRTRVEAVSAEDVFRKYKVGPKVEIRKLKITPDAAIESMRKILIKANRFWRRKHFWGRDHLDASKDALFNYLVRTMKEEKLEFSSREIARFSILLGTVKMKEHDPDVERGLTLSAMIEVSEDMDFEVHNYDNVPISCLGYRNRKNVYVSGDLKYDTASFMSAGKIQIKGSVGFGLGNEMTGGEIFVEGDVRGITDINIGNGGEIHIKGRLSGLSNLHRVMYHLMDGTFEEKRDGVRPSTRIFADGKMVFPKV